MRFSFESRCRLVALIVEGMSPPAAAAAGGTTGYRLWRRYRSGGWAALLDRPSTPRRQPRRLLREAEQEILAWRAELKSGPGGHRDHRRAALLHGRQGAPAGGLLAPSRPARVYGPRYERARSGELLRMDTKKPGGFWAAGKRPRRPLAVPARRDRRSLASVLPEGEPFALSAGDGHRPAPEFVFEPTFGRRLTEVAATTPASVRWHRYASGCPRLTTLL
jgi:hypothetical protein